MRPPSTPAVDWSPSREGGQQAALTIGVVVLAAVYILLFLSGIRFFVMKTSVLPVILIVGLVNRQHRAAFVQDWLPLLTGLILFDAVRGAIWVAIQNGWQTYQVGYVVSLEQLVFGVPALPLPLQALRRHWLDVTTVMVHASHFLFFLLFGLVLWVNRRSHFALFRRAFGLLILLGLVCYAVVPTAPPWLASNPAFNLLPPIPRIVADIYTMTFPNLFDAFSTNPVAAMPSLHTAFPVLCALIAWRAYGAVIGSLVSAYAVAVMFSVIYLGEHYGVDVLAGAIVAVVAYVAAQRTEPLRMTTRAELALSGAGVAATFLIITLTH